MATDLSKMDNDSYMSKLNMDFRIGRPTTHWHNMLQEFAKNQKMCRAEEKCGENHMQHGQRDKRPLERGGIVMVQGKAKATTTTRSVRLDDVQFRRSEFFGVILGGLRSTGRAARAMLRVSMPMAFLWRRRLRGPSARLTSGACNRNGAYLPLLLRAVGSCGHYLSA